MAGEKQPFLVYLCLWKVQFSPGHIYCPTFFSLISAFSGCVSIQGCRTELFSSSEVLAPRKSNDKMLIGLLLLELASSVVQYVSICHLSQYLILIQKLPPFCSSFQPQNRQSKCLLLCRFSHGSAFLFISPY